MTTLTTSHLKPGKSAFGEAPRYGESTGKERRCDKAVAAHSCSVERCESRLLTCAKFGRSLSTRDRCGMRLFDRAARSCDEAPASFGSSIALEATQRGEERITPCATRAGESFDANPLVADADRIGVRRGGTDASHRKLDFVEEPWREKRTDRRGDRCPPTLRNGNREAPGKRPKERRLAKSRLDPFEADSRRRPPVNGNDDAYRAAPAKWNHDTIARNQRLGVIEREIVVETLPCCAREIHCDAQRARCLAGRAHTSIRRSGCFARSARTIFSTCAAASSG